MPWFDRWRRPAETGDEQLARLRHATPEPPAPTGPPADLPTQLARLRTILEHLEHYRYYRGGNLHADVAAAVSTLERPLTARRVALVHEADPADLPDLTAAELAQIAGVALRHPDRLARDPAAVAAAAANLDLLHAFDACRRHLGALPAVRPDPDLATPQGRHAYAAALRRAVRRQTAAAVWDNPRLHWGRPEDGPPGPPPAPRPLARAAVIAEFAGMLPLLLRIGQATDQDAVTDVGAASAAPGALGAAFAAWAARVNRERGFAYHFRGSLGRADWPFYLSDHELAEAVRQAREATAARAGGATAPRQLGR